MYRVRERLIPVYFLFLSFCPNSSTQGFGDERGQFLLCAYQKLLTHGMFTAECIPLPVMQICLYINEEFFKSVQSCPTLCDPWTAACQASLSISSSQSLLKLMSIQQSPGLLSPSPSAHSLSQHQGLFQWVSSLHQVAKVLEFQLQH